MSSSRSGEEVERGGSDEEGTVCVSSQLRVSTTCRVYRVVCVVVLPSSSPSSSDCAIAAAALSSPLSLSPLSPFHVRQSAHPTKHTYKHSSSKKKKKEKRRENRNKGGKDAADDTSSYIPQSRAVSIIIRSVRSRSLIVRTYCACNEVAHEKENYHHHLVALFSDQSSHGMVLFSSKNGVRC